MDSSTITAIMFAILGGALPTFAWLFFWLREDNKNPEPKKMLLIAFLGGVMAVFISMYLEKLIFPIEIKDFLSAGYLNNILSWIKDYSLNNNIPFDRLLLVAVFAPIIEECAKFIMAIILVLRSKEDNEPIDPIVYMITVAIGFAAIENTFFLIDPFIKNDLIHGIMTGNMRFIGATLLHTVSSASIGLFIGFNFYDSKMKKIVWSIAGLISAISLHALFNIFMIDNNGSNGFMALQLLWIIVIVVLLLFERIKKIKTKNTQEQNGCF